jgi:outer membrane protein assembly factor BamB
MKFKGNWEGAYGGKDSILYWQTKPIAKEKALYSYAKVVYKGKIVLESWAIYAFDQEINKVIWFELLSDQTLLTYRGEFTSATTLDLNISSKTAPETVLVTLRLQFRTPDVLDVTETNQSSGAKNAYVFKRTKQ